MLFPTYGPAGKRKKRTRLFRSRGVVVGARLATVFLAIACFVGLVMFETGKKRHADFRTAAAGDAPSDFVALRDQCLRENRLFKDPDFEADDSSLYFSKIPTRIPRQEIEWKRPTKIVNKPNFFIEGASRFDVKQGRLGDCWLLAAIANLTLNKKLFNQVVPTDQEYDDKYAGIFHFRFWQFGKWIDVIIDDRLPILENKLVYVHSQSKNEFWSALLEKAYAKLHGSYEALKSGLVYEASVDFSGGLSEIFYFDEKKYDIVFYKRLFTTMLQAYERQSLMGAGIMRQSFDDKKSKGLINNHAFSITKVCSFMNTHRLPLATLLIRLRNPWGDDHEWKGAWSDNSPEWNLIPESDRKILGLTFDTDGEFWMSYDDFIKNFSVLDMCHLTSDILSTGHHDNCRNLQMWVTSVFEGKWVRGGTAGGNRYCKETFSSNPQFRIVLENPDGVNGEKKCTVIIELMQKNRRKPKKNKKLSLLKIGFTVYRLTKCNSKPLDQEFFDKTTPLEQCDFRCLRQVSKRYRLAPGTYCIVPSTYTPNEEAEFLLRVFPENENNMREIDNSCEIVEISGMAEALDCIPQTTNKSTKKIIDLVLKVAGRDECIDWMDLKEVLNYAFKYEIGKPQFSKDMCRSIIALADTDRSGKLSFEEFITLWKDLMRWKTVFEKYQQKKNGNITGFELRKAMNSVGYFINTNVLNILCHRYGNKKGYISFDDFIMCALRLKMMTDIFIKNRHDRENVASFTMEEWLEKTMYW